MTTLEDQKEEVCQCRNPKCRKVFNQSEIKHIHIERFGQQITEAVCPHCKSNIYKFGLIDYPISEYELIFKNGDFYRLYRDQIKQMKIDNLLRIEGEFN